MEPILNATANIEINVVFMLSPHKLCMIGALYFRDTTMFTSVFGNLIMRNTLSLKCAFKTLEIFAQVSMTIIALNIVKYKVTRTHKIFLYGNHQPKSKSLVNSQRERSHATLINSEEL